MTRRSPSRRSCGPVPAGSKRSRGRADPTLCSTFATDDTPSYSALEEVRGEPPHATGINGASPTISSGSCVGCSSAPVPSQSFLSCAVLSRAASRLPSRRSTTTDGDDHTGNARAPAALRPVRMLRSTTTPRRPQGRPSCAGEGLARDGSVDWVGDHRLVAPAAGATAASMRAPALITNILNTLLPSRSTTTAKVVGRSRLHDLGSSARCTSPLGGRGTGWNARHEVLAM